MDLIKAMGLLNDIITRAKLEDDKLKQAKLKQREAVPPGESWMIHYLQVLKEELVKQISVCSIDRPTSYYLDVRGGEKCKITTT